MNYDYAESDVLLTAAQRSLMATPDVTGYGIDERNDRLEILAATDASAAQIWASLKAADLPEDAFQVTVSGPPSDISCSGLQKRCSPMMAGLQSVNNDKSGGGLCSIGYVGWRTDTVYQSQPDTSYRVITTASHCSNSQTQTGGSFYQDSLYPATRHVGVEIEDAPVYPHATCAAWGYVYNRCRYADVTVIHIDDSVAVAGGIAAISNTATPPPWLGQRAYTGSGVIGVLSGDSVTSIGRSGGQRYGSVNGTCYDVNDGTLTDLWNLCQGRANFVAYTGDSGGMVYVKSGDGTGASPRPAGTMIQYISNAASPSSVRSADPCCVRIPLFPHL